MLLIHLRFRRVELKKVPMYIPTKMAMTDAQSIAEFISKFGFGALVSDNLNATHLPFILAPDEGAFGCLYGHFARANPHWEAAEGKRVMVLFNGPHSYISPTWYSSQPAVPTWNYAAVHCYGVLTLLNESENAQAMQQLVRKYEPELLEANEVMPEDYQARLRKAVVGFKIEIDAIHAKEKLGQHRKKEDQQGVYAALCNSDHADDRALAAYMKKRKLGLGND